MAKYHINTAGEPALCRATKRPCPRGGEDAHYPDKKTALEAVEKKYSKDTLTKVTKKATPASSEDPWADYTIEELSQLEEESLAAHIESGEPLSDEEYDRRREYVRRVNRAYPSTHKENTVKVKGKTQYSEARQKMHEEIITELEEQYSSVPSEGKALLTSGMPGSGKTTLLNKVVGDSLKNYAVVNPDDVKVKMAERGMTPKVKALTPLETDELIMYEANVIQKELFTRLASRRKNLVLDRTMLRPGPVEKDIEHLKSQGYRSVTVLFADISPDTAYSRIAARHREGVNDYIKSGGKTLGARVVPGSAISVSRIEDSPHNSMNSETLVALHGKGLFTETPRVFDTTDGHVEKPFDSLGRVDPGKE